MPPPLPDCPRCDAAATLKKIRDDDKGSVWAYCECCSTTVLLDANGVIVHVGSK